MDKRFLDTLYVPQYQMHCNNLIRLYDFVEDPVSVCVELAVVQDGGLRLAVSGSKCNSQLMVSSLLLANS